MHKIGAENFPVALRVLPRRVRDDLVRVYRFARFVDDVGDEAAGDRLALLDIVDKDVQALDGGEPTLPPVREMQPLVGERGIATSLLRDLVEANRRDQQVLRYETFEQLLDYCRLSAAPVGRMVLGIAGVDDTVAAELSDRVCAALQVLEHCQDVGEDADLGRVYLPAADLAAAGVGDDDVRDTSTSPALRRVVAVQVDRAAELLTAGRPLVRRLSGWSRVAVLGYVAGGEATVAALRNADYDVLGRKIHATRTALVRHAASIAMTKVRP
jgi:squalene synthase HpnC